MYANIVIPSLLNEDLHPSDKKRFNAMGPNKIWGRGIDLRTPWKIFSLRSWPQVRNILTAQVAWIQRWIQYRRQSKRSERALAKSGGGTKICVQKLLFRSCTATILCNFKIRPAAFLSSFRRRPLIARKIYPQQWMLPDVQLGFC